MAGYQKTVTPQEQARTDFEDGIKAANGIADIFQSASIDLYKQLDKLTAGNLDTLRDAFYDKLESSNNSIVAKIADKIDDLDDALLEDRIGAVKTLRGIANALDHIDTISDGLNVLSSVKGILQTGSAADFEKLGESLQSLGVGIIADKISGAAHKVPVIGETLGAVTDLLFDDLVNDTLNLSKIGLGYGFAWTYALITGQRDLWDEMARDATERLNNYPSETLDTLRDLRDLLGPLQGLLPEWLQEDTKPGTESARTEASPLILDLDGDGVELVALNAANSVYWDIDLDGRREASGWVGSDDGLLALDINGDGAINNHAELFGDQTTDGFTILAGYDTNADGVINVDDAIYSQLLIWRDANSDGVSQASELMALGDAGVAEISLTAATSTAVIAGNRVTHTASWKDADGASHSIVDAWFQYDDINTIYDGPPVEIPFDALLLPTLRGYGRIDSLQIAMATDETLLAEVKALATKSLGDFLNPSSDVEDAFRAMLWQWAGVEGATPNGRGSYIDGRDLAFLEALTDRPFLQRGFSNPYVEASTTLLNAMEKAHDALLFRFFVQLFPDSFIKGVNYYDEQSDEVDRDISFDFAALSNLVSGWNATGAELTEGWGTIIRLIDGAVGLERLTASDRTALDNAIKASDSSAKLNLDAVVNSVFPPRGLGLNGTSGPDTINGGQGNDSIDGGNDNDILNGRGGHDTLNGGNGNDTLNGETGDDTMLGGTGNDTYIYTSGLDTIRDASGVDKIVMPSGITLAGLRFDYAPNNITDLFIYHNDVLILIIEDHFSVNGGIETMVFADNSTLNLGALISQVLGTSADNILNGNDSSLFPHDQIYGYAGNDTLNGGLGNDVLVGGAGNDVYIVSTGQDVISDESGVDEIRFGAGYDASRIGLDRQGYDLFISYDGANILKITNQFRNGDAIEKLVFADGQIIDLLTHSYTTTGTSANDNVFGINEGGGGDILLGLAGNDRIYGYDGNDSLTGGQGNDYVAGGLGNDIYFYASGDGLDTIEDQKGTDEIRFGPGFALADMQLTRESSSLAIAFGGVTVLRLYGQFSQYGGIETIRFNDGATVDLLSVAYAVTGTAANENLSGISYGGNPNDVMDGMGGNDRLYGYLGDDTLNGGEGDDQLYGGYGNDIYIASAGSDRLQEGRGEGSDTVKLWAGVGLSDIGFERIGQYDLSILNKLTGDRLQISYFFASGYVTGEIETFQLGDGTPITDLGLRNWTLNGTSANETLYGVSYSGLPDDTLNGMGGTDRLYGYAGNDTLDGGEGNDSLYGGAGNDTYLASAGIDYIQENRNEGSDTLKLWAGATLTDLAFERIGQYNLLIGNKLTGDIVEIANFFNATYPTGEIETFLLGDGTAITDLGTRKWVLNGSSGNDYLYGIGGSGNLDDTLNGLAGTDRLYGLAGNDTLDGGEGGDFLYGGVGDDLYLASTGADFIQENRNEGSDTLKLWAGAGLSDIGFNRLGQYDLQISNYLTGDSLHIYNFFNASYVMGEVETYLLGDGTAITDLGTRKWVNNGTTGNDYLYGIGGSGNPDDTMYGQAGTDRLYGYAGNDTLDGGEGSDYLYGGLGDDLYLASAGADYIQENRTEGSDTLKLWAGAALSDIAFDRFGQYDLQIRNLLTGDSIQIANFFNASYPTGEIETFLLGDGTAIADIGTRKWVMNGTGNNETLYGIAGSGILDDSLNGLGGADRLYGYAGNDTLDGGEGGDQLYGGIGNDLYLASAGADYVQENRNEGSDTLKLWAGAALADLGFARIGQYGLLISNKLTGDTIEVANFFNASYPTGEIETYLLGDGTAITDLGTRKWVMNGTSASDSLYGIGGSGILDDTLNGLGGVDRLYGYAGNDTLDGGEGNDYLYGGVGDDLYRASAGSDVIQENRNEGSDTLRLWAGVSLADISFNRLGQYDLQIGNKLTGDLIQIVNFFSASYPTGEIETYLLGDGTVIADIGTRSWTMSGGSGNDYLYGIAGSGNLDDTLNGLAGTDRLYGYDGNDTLDGGEGADYLYGGLGDDIFVLDNPADFVSEGTNQGFDTIRASFTYTLLVNFEGLELTGNANINGTGNAGDNVLVGNSGKNILTGLEGDDALDGGEGADTLIGGKGDDTYFVDSGGDAITELNGEGTDTVAASVSYNLKGQYLENMVLTGNASINATGNSLDNILVGNDGNNVIDGMGGVDAMAGGKGDDTYYVDNGGDKVIEQFDQGIDTVISSVGFVLKGQHIENLTFTGSGNLGGTGNSLDNRLTGNSGANKLEGLAGHDVLDGGAGADTLIGGEGDDSYYVDDAGDVVTELSGQGTDTVFASVTYSLKGRYVENLTLTGSGNISATGNSFANILIGNDGNNALDGSTGADSMSGGKGDDSYFVDDLGDKVIELANEGTDKVYASISFSLKGQHLENLTLTGTDNIAATGNSFANVLVGNSGDNVLDGSTGADTMSGGKGNDSYFVDDAGDTVTEKYDEGIDKVYASVSFSLKGQYLEHLTLTGNASLYGIGNSLANNLTGNSGANVLEGLAGNDILNGGLGADILTGGADRDIFLFASALGGGNIDLIKDYNLADDSIQLDRKIFTAISVGTLQANQFVNGTAALDADDRILYDAASGAVYYDADGNGAIAAIQFATIGNHAALNAGEFLIY